MSEKFLLGEVYNSITDEIFETKMRESTEFEKLMDNYLNEVYNNISSKIVQWNLYKQYILYYEEALDKSLYKFNIEELNNLILAIPSSSGDVIDAVFGLCNQYLEWCVYKNLISINNMKALDRNELVKVDKKSARSKIITGDKFYDMLVELEKHTNPQNFTSLVLAHIGLMGADLIEIRNAKISDIDRENMKIRVINEETGEVIKELDITERDLVWIDKAISISESDPTTKYVNTDRIIKVTTKGNTGDVIGEQSLYNRINNAFKSGGIKRVSFKDINRSARIEMLLEIRKHKLLTTNDVYDVSKYFEPSISRGGYNSLKKLYESVTGENVAAGTTKEPLETDGKEFVENLKRELGIIKG